MSIQWTFNWVIWFYFPSMIQDVVLSLVVTLLQMSEIFTWNYFQNQFEAY